MKKLKIVLIAPKYSDCHKKFYDYAFPIGLSYISGALDQAGIEHECINLNHHQGSSSEQLLEILNRTQYDIVATGGISLNYAVIKSMFQVIHEHAPEIISVLGGPIITTEPDLIMELFKPTFGVIGEGEETIVELIKSLEHQQTPNDVAGIIFEQNGKLISTASRKSISDLDMIPFPAIENLGYLEWLGKQGCNYSQYTNFVDIPRLYIILGSRGCPFQCTFCFHYGKYRERSLENVFAELEPAVMKYKINIVCFDDDCLSIKKERLFEFCRRFQNLRNKVSWDIQFVVQLVTSTVDEEILDELKSSGCNTVSYGFESYSPVVLKSMMKPLKPEQIDFAVQETQKRNITIQGNFIFGDIAETFETADATLNYWKKHSNSQISLAFVQPYPGSVIYNHCLKNSIIEDKVAFMENNIADEVPLNLTTGISDSDFEHLVANVYNYRRKYRHYAVPRNISRTSNDTYSMKVTCPFCKAKIKLSNVSLENIKYYEIDFACRKCARRFIICSLRERLKLFLGGIIYNVKALFNK